MSFCPYRVLVTKATTQPHQKQAKALNRPRGLLSLLKLASLKDGHSHGVPGVVNIVAFGCCFTASLCEVRGLIRDGQGHASVLEDGHDGRHEWPGVRVVLNAQEPDVDAEQGFIQHAAVRDRGVHQLA
jgi:hypothetical protein